MAKNDRIVYRRDDGKWVNKKISASRASSLHDTQRDALATAEHMLRRSGGGELTTKGRDGHIHRKDTVRGFISSSKQGKIDRNDIKTVVNAVHVVQSDKGGWAIKGSGARIDTAHFDTQREAIQFAREVVRNRKGNMIIHRRDGKIQRVDVSGKDKGKERVNIGK